MKAVITCLFLYMLFKNSSVKTEEDEDAKAAIPKNRVAHP